MTVDALRTAARKEMRWLFADFPEIGGQCGGLAVCTVAFFWPRSVSQLAGVSAAAPLASGAPLTLANRSA